jgi:hypothetical protein
MNPSTPPSRRVALVSGCAANFFHHQIASLDSIAALRRRERFDVVIIDLGLEAHQIERLQSQYDARVVSARWPFEPPARVKTPYPLAFAVRPYLPRLLPGYDVFLWLDSDAWVQDDRFYDRYVGAAENGSFAIAREDDPSYRHDLRSARWHYGNMFAGFGLEAGIRMLGHPPINEGVWAARADHPIWYFWQVHYERVLRRTGKANLDQHIVHLLAARREVKMSLVPCEFNWICTRAAPVLDTRRNLLLSPRTLQPLSVLHLAGPDKERLYTLATLDGGTVKRRLTFEQRAPATDCATPPTRPMPLGPRAHAA